MALGCCGSLQTGKPLFTMDAAIAEGLGAKSSLELQLVPFNCSASYCDCGSSNIGVCQECFDITMNMTIAADMSDAKGRNVTLSYDNLYLTNPVTGMGMPNDHYLYQLFNYSLSPFQKSSDLPLSELGISTFRTIKLQTMTVWTNGQKVDILLCNVTWLSSFRK